MFICVHIKYKHLSRSEMTSDSLQVQGQNSAKIIYYIFKKYFTMLEFLRKEKAHRLQF